ncbi:hypothetical protein WR25_03222 [Diploscapter pachys]|uniref:Uncharacterized protein n=1 Tax=Diploscapter pachys TaxID=2018661 RepID=A0A2A2JQ14_9BILA|nr:hypothetical protein WR25_03222 [Diploscapter pachys]
MKNGDFDSSYNIDLDSIVQAFQNAYKLEHKIADVLEHLLFEKDDFISLSWPKILEFYKFTQIHDSESMKKLHDAIRGALWEKICAIDLPSKLLEVLKCPQLNVAIAKLLTQKSCDLLPMMNTNELISLLWHYAQLGVRPQNLVTRLPQFLVNQKSTVGANQIVRLASACMKLTLTDQRLINRLCSDINYGINSFQKVNDLTSVMNSLVRLRVGNVSTWKAMINWVLSHQVDIPLPPLTTFVGGLAQIGCWEGREVAAIAAKRVFRPLTGMNEIRWLSLIHAFAYFKVLSTGLVETVLNKSFIEAVFKSQGNDASKLFAAQKLLQISGCAQYEMQNYNGQLFTFEDLRKIDGFPQFESDRKMVNLAGELRFSKEGYEGYLNNFMVPVLQNVVPPSVKQEHSLDQFGSWIDAVIVRNEETSSLLPVKEWKPDSRKVPIIFVPERRTKIPTLLTHAEQPIFDLLGPDQLSIRLMHKVNRAEPILIFESDLNQTSNTTVAKIASLKEIILKETPPPNEQNQEAQ